MSNAAFDEIAKEWLENEGISPAYEHCLDELVGALSDLLHKIARDAEAVASKRRPRPEDQIWNSAITAAMKQCRVHVECGCGDSYCRDCDEDRARRYSFGAQSPKEIRDAIKALKRKQPR